jgi:DNA polymerase elongation subunit (family B)
MALAPVTKKSYHNNHLLYVHRGEYPEGPQGETDYQHAWRAFVAKLPQRDDFLLTEQDQISRSAYAARKPVWFQPVGAYDFHARFDGGSQRYALLLTGLVRGGAKAVALITGIRPCFEVRIPVGITPAYFKERLQADFKVQGFYCDEMCEVEGNHEHQNPITGKVTVERRKGLYPPKEYHEEPVPYLRIFTKTTYDRNKIIRWLNATPFHYYNDIDKETVDAKLETAADDTSCYYRVVSRKYRLQLANWMRFRSYQDLKALGMVKPGIHYTFRIDIQNIETIDDMDTTRNPKREQKPNLSDNEYRDMVRPNILLMCWDLETFSIVSRNGEPPQVDRVFTGNNKLEDLIIMNGMSLHWYSDNTPLVMISITDLPAPPCDDCLVIQVGEQSEIIRVMALLMERLQPDLVSGFNDGAYDWPFVLKRCEEYDRNFLGSDLMSTLINESCVLKVTPDMRKFLCKPVNYGTKDLGGAVKIDAETSVNPTYLDVPGYICIDTCVIFRQLNPSSEQYSLSFFLEKNQLDGKEHFAYTRMFRCYRIMRQLSHLLDTANYGDILERINVWLRMPERGPNWRPFGVVDMADNPFDRPDASTYGVEDMTLSEIREAILDVREAIHYCNVDALRCQNLLKKANVINDKRETGNSTFTSTYDALYRAGGMRVRNTVMAEAVLPQWNIAFSNFNAGATKSPKKYPGAYVLPPRKGLYRDHRWLKMLRLLHMIHSETVGNWNGSDLNHHKQAYELLFKECIIQHQRTVEGDMTITDEKMRERYYNDYSEHWVLPQHPNFIRDRRVEGVAIQTGQQRLNEVWDAIVYRLLRSREVHYASQPPKMTPMNVNLRRLTDEELCDPTREEHFYVKTGVMLKKMLVDDNPNKPTGTVPELRLKTLAQLVRDGMCSTSLFYLIASDGMGYYSIPQTQELERNPDIFPGNDKPNSGIDFNSLYPSIAMCFNYSPEKWIHSEKAAIALSKRIDRRTGNLHKIREVSFNYCIPGTAPEAIRPEEKIRAWFVQHESVLETADKDGKLPLDELGLRRIKFHAGMSIYSFVLKRGFDIRVGLKGILKQWGEPYEFLRKLVSARRDAGLLPVEKLPIEDQVKTVRDVMEKEMAKRDAAYKANPHPILKGKCKGMEEIHKFIESEFILHVSSREYRIQHVVQDLKHIKSGYDAILKSEAMGATNRYQWHLTASYEALSAALSKNDGSDKEAIWEAIQPFLPPIPPHARNFETFFDEVSYQFTYYNGKQIAAKTLLNCFYGEAGYSISSLFALPVAGGITSTGQWLLKTMKGWLEPQEYDILYGDTDSLYVCPPESAFREINDEFESGRITKLERWARMADATILAMNKCRDSVCRMLYRLTGTRFMNVAFEEALWPCAFLGKKKYLGVKHEGLVNLRICTPECSLEEFSQAIDKANLFVRGLELKKRGGSNFLKKACFLVLHRAFSINEHHTLRQITEEVLGQISITKWDPALFSRSAKYKPNTKKPDGTPKQGNKPVLEFMARMSKVAEEHPAWGIRPADPGARFRYIVVRRYPQEYDMRGRTHELRASMCREYEDVVLHPEKYKEYLTDLGESRLDPDIDYYILSEICGQFARFLTYHPDYDHIWQEEQTIQGETDEKDMDQLYKAADKNGIALAKKQLESWYTTNYASRYRNYATTYQRIFRESKKRIVGAWEGRYGDAGRMVSLGTDLVTRQSESRVGERIERNTDIVDEMLRVMIETAKKETAHMSFMNVEETGKQIGLKLTTHLPKPKPWSVSQVEWYYLGQLRGWEAVNKVEYQEVRRELLQLLPELQEFSFRQAEWLSTSVRAMIREAPMDRQPLPPHTVTGAVTAPSPKAKAKPRVTATTTTEVIRRDKLQVEVHLAEDDMDNIVQLSLDPEAVDDQDEHEELVYQIYALYQRLVVLEYRHKEMEIVRSAVQDMSRVAGKAPGANMRVVREDLKPGGHFMQDFGSFLQRMGPPRESE